MLHRMGFSPQVPVRRAAERAARHWPGEPDLMAERADLRLRERHSNWDRRPFTNSSANHVSVYQRP
jgi:hypothetical protein